jgi:hypothetical protein
MSDFQYKSGATWYDVPATAHPDDESGSITVEYPAAAAIDGQGDPAGAVGQPELIIAGRMNGTGMAFWTAFFASATAETATLTGITGYDPRTAAWVKYTGTLWRPQAKVKPGASAGSTWYENVLIRVKNLVVTT